MCFELGFLFKMFLLRSGSSRMDNYPACNNLILYYTLNSLSSLLFVSFLSDDVVGLILMLCEQIALNRFLLFWFFFLTVFLN